MHQALQLIPETEYHTSILEDALQNVRRYSGDFPDYRTAMDMYQRLDMYTSLPEDKVSGSVSYLAKKRGYSRKTVQRAQSSDSRLADMIKSSDISYAHTPATETRPDDIYHRFNETRKALGYLANSDELRDLEHRALTTYDFFSDPVFQSIDTRLNREITPSEATSLRRERMVQIASELRTNLYNQLVCQLPFEAQLYALAEQAIRDSSSYEEGKRIFDHSYYSLLADNLGYDIKQISEVSGQCEKTVANKLANSNPVTFIPYGSNQAPNYVGMDFTGMSDTSESQRESQPFEWPDKLRLV